MRRSLYLGLLVCLVVGGVGWRYGAEIVSLGAVTSAVSGPEDGRIAEGVYRNAYFDLSLPLPDDWTEGLAGPDPSAAGYYVLGTLVPKGELTGTILIAAQDTFFAGEEWSTTAAAANALHHAMSQVGGMTVGAEPAALTVAGRAMHRIDFSGVGLHRSLFVTDIRCHVVSFKLTARDEARLESLRLSLNRLAFAANRRSAAAAIPCVKDYVVADNLVERVEPQLPAANLEPIPVRLVIDAQGAVRQVRVIRASGGQRQAIEAALRRWKFKPPRVDGRPTEIETGVLFKSTIAAR